MSGLCGFIGRAQGVNNKEQVLQAMADKILHRGPDAEGYYIDENAAIGFRLLSVSKMVEAHQPMASRDNGIVVTMDGVIYNYCEIRSELIDRGYEFATNSDSEILLHGWQEYGEGLLGKLRGMFAFIIWDANTQLAFGARDFFGVKPFYFAQKEGSFVFASEIKSILEYPGIKPELNLEALEQYLSLQYSILPETFFKGVFRLGPGECFTIKEGEMTIRRYFDPVPAAVLADTVSFEQTVEQIKQVVSESVLAHQSPDVEIASLLSSGVDSSYIAALNPHKRAYTIGFETADGVKYNEISYAQQTADELGKTHRSQIIAPDEYWDAVPRIMYYMDEPLADPSAVALYFLDRLVAEDVKVVFSGEGADEFFGGYPIYHEPMGLAGFQKLPRGLRKAFAAVTRAVPFKFKGKSFLDRASKTVEERYVSNAFHFSVAEREALLKAPMHAPSPHILVQPYYARVTHADDTGKMQYIDYNFWQPGNILLKGDRMAMANSLECRVPLLDLRVFALANTLPLEYRVNNETTKVAFRAAALSVLPESIATKPKLGFPTPIRVWLKEDRWYQRVRELFEGSTAERFFNTGLLVRLLDDHRSGKADNSRKIWVVYVFIIWYQVYFENDKHLS